MSQSVKKRSFTLAEKQAIASEYVQGDHPLHVVAAKYQIKSISTIHKWANNPNLFHPDMTPVPLNRRQSLSKTLHTGPKLKRPLLEAHLFAFFEEKREDGSPVDINLLITEAMRFSLTSEEESISSLGESGMRDFCQRFMRRYKIGYPAKTRRAVEAL